MRVANQQLLVSLSVIFPPPMLKGARSLNSQLLGLKGTSSWQPVVLGDDRVAVSTCRHRRRRIGLPVLLDLGLILFLGERPNCEGSVSRMTSMMGLRWRST